MVDVRSYFELRLDRYGDSPKALEWSRTGQLRRFKVLTEVGNLIDRDVLDVGCGLGHLYDFIRERRLHVRYWGLDFSPRMIDAARRRHPRTSFEVHDALFGRLPRRADFVLASGILNVKTGSNETAIRRFLRNAFDAARSAVAVNMLSRWANAYNPKMHYYDPIRILEFAHRLTHRVVLRHDYMPHDFTVYLYRERRK